jgi:TM2 domain-containing membrane protein YozV
MSNGKLQSNESDLYRDCHQSFLAKPEKNRVVALTLSLFLGIFGADQFYLGKYGYATCKLLFSWLTFGVWQIIDLIPIADMSERITTSFRWRNEEFDKALLVLFFIFFWHRFYIKQGGLGLIYILSLGGFGIWFILDLVHLIRELGGWGTYFVNRFEKR